MEVARIDNAEKLKENLIKTTVFMEFYLQRPEFEDYLNLIVTKPLNEALKLDEVLEIDQNK